MKIFTIKQGIVSAGVRIESDPESDKSFIAFEGSDTTVPVIGDFGTCNSSNETNLEGVIYRCSVGTNRIGNPVIIPEYPDDDYDDCYAIIVERRGDDDEELLYPYGDYFQKDKYDYDRTTEHIMNTFINGYNQRIYRVLDNTVWYSDKRVKYIYKNGLVKNVTGERV